MSETRSRFRPFARLSTVLRGGVLVLLAALASPARGEPQNLILRAAGRVDLAGEIQQDGLVVIRDGRIVQVGGQAPAGAAVVDFPGAVLMPGLIDIESNLGAPGQLSESADVIDGMARARDAFNRHHSRLRAASAEGVTSFALCPDDLNLVAGRIAVCRTASAGAAPDLVSAEGPLKLSLSPAVYRTERRPTSRSGAIGMLRDLLAKPSDGGPALVEFATGSCPGFVATPSGADVLALLSMLESVRDCRVYVRHSEDAGDVAGELAARKIPVVVGPLDFRSSPRALRAAGILEAAGVNVAIAGGLPGEPADSLRVGAALAARYGMSPAAARRAISTVPADLLGVSGRIGGLVEGRSADVIVFSGDPLDLRSRVLAVYVAGVRQSPPTTAE